ncbi:MAG: hypothetical protein MZV64_18000 [Ignavibacteriales bacterium]|nr:hypothetical protein [Ignavibacteriales bacterium]
MTPLPLRVCLPSSGQAYGKPAEPRRSPKNSNGKGVSLGAARSPAPGYFINPMKPIRWIFILLAFLTRHRRGTCLRLVHSGPVEFSTCPRHAPCGLQNRLRPDDRRSLPHSEQDPGTAARKISHFRREDPCRHCRRSIGLRPHERTPRFRHRPPAGPRHRHASTERDTPMKRPWYLLGPVLFSLLGLGAGLAYTGVISPRGPDRLRPRPPARRLQGPVPLRHCRVLFSRGSLPRARQGWRFWSDTNSIEALNAQAQRTIASGLRSTDQLAALAHKPRKRRGRPAAGCRGDNGRLGAGGYRPHPDCLPSRQTSVSCLPETARRSWKPLPSKPNRLLSSTPRPTPDSAPPRVHPSS